MEYVQERIATLHSFVDPPATNSLDETAVVVPLDERDYASEATQRTFSVLDSLDPGRVVVPLRASPKHVGTISAWLDGFSFDSVLLWCNAPSLETYLDTRGFDARAGKGRDVWLALGLTEDVEYVVVHDADARTYDETHVQRLLFALLEGYEFSKGYYARIENGRLYGRLYRLFVAPVMELLEETVADPLVAYLGAFRYPLAGEIAMTGELARRLQPPSGWGFEIATLGDAYREVGFAGTAQVDLGVHEHDHRPVAGEGGLNHMADEVARTLFSILEDHGLDFTYPRFRRQYRERAFEFVERYALDAAFNDFEYDRTDECAQVLGYEDAIAPPCQEDPLPSWEQTSLEPAELYERSHDALNRARESAISK